MDADQTSLPLVRYAVQGLAATITLDSPGNRNALSHQLMDQLEIALARAGQEPGARAVVLTHTGGTFCAGADLHEASAATEPQRRRGERLTGLLRLILTLEVPVIAVVNGHVRAGGMGLVGACDLALAGPRASFALTEVRLGLAAAMVSSVVVPRLSDRDAARLLLTGAVIDADEAARIGFLTASAPDPQAALAQVLDQLRSCSPQGLREVKAMLNRSLLATFDADRDRLVDLSTRLFDSAEAREGMAAFLGKRPPRWAD
ncbi:MAG: enoyl-CoA hydratase family protein [Nostocoides sp.]